MYGELYVPICKSVQHYPFKTNASGTLGHLGDCKINEDAKNASLHYHKTAMTKSSINIEIGAEAKPKLGMREWFR